MRSGGWWWVWRGGWGTHTRAIACPAHAGPCVREGGNEKPRSVDRGSRGWISDDREVVGSCTLGGRAPGLGSSPSGRPLNRSLVQAESTNRCRSSRDLLAATMRQEMPPSGRQTGRRWGGGEGSQAGPNGRKQAGTRGEVAGEGILGLWCPQGVQATFLIGRRTVGGISLRRPGVPRGVLRRCGGRGWRGEGHFGPVRRERARRGGSRRRGRGSPRG